MAFGMKKTKDLSAKLHAYANNVRPNIWQSLRQCMLIWGFKAGNTRTTKSRNNESSRGNTRQLHSCCRCTWGKCKQTNNEGAFEYAIAVRNTKISKKNRHSKRWCMRPYMDMDVLYVAAASEICLQQLSAELCTYLK